MLKNRFRQGYFNSAQKIADSHKISVYLKLRVNNIANVASHSSAPTVNLVCVELNFQINPYSIHIALNFK